MVYNKEPILVVYEMLSELADEIPIYKEIMDEDEDSTPDSYIVIFAQVNDSAKSFGDGATLIRSADCDINLISKGTAGSSTSLHNINKRKIADLLEKKNVIFTQRNLGYNDSLKISEHNFSVLVHYGFEK